MEAPVLSGAAKPFVPSGNDLGRRSKVWLGMRFHSADQKGHFKPTDLILTSAYYVMTVVFNVDPQACTKGLTHNLNLRHCRDVLHSWENRMFDGFVEEILSRYFRSAY
jgi:hypothetical protein